MFYPRNITFFIFLFVVIKCPSKYELYSTAIWVEQEEKTEYYVRDNDDDKFEKFECDEDECPGYFNQLIVNHSSSIAKVASMDG